VAAKKSNTGNSKSSSSNGVNKHRLWSIIGVVFALLVVGLLVVYPMLSGKKVATAGHATEDGSEDCTNGADDDLDGQTDCYDTDCLDDGSKGSKAIGKPGPGGALCCYAYSQCPSGQSCLGVQCVTPAKFGENCNPPTTVCDSNLFCDSGKCMGSQDYGCTLDNQCGIGYACQNGKCENTAQEKNCVDKSDNDGDTKIDCADDNCAGKIVAKNTESGCNLESGCTCYANEIPELGACNDGFDNDADNLVDCKDSDCKDYTGCINKKISEGATKLCLPFYIADQEEGTAWINCVVSDVQTHATCSKEWYKLEKDNTMSGLQNGCVNFEDEEWCATNVVNKFVLKSKEGSLTYIGGDCSVKEEGAQCTDSQDNDLDGTADCKDSDCAAENVCKDLLKETDHDCHDGLDNDNDKTIDCMDSDCKDGSFCTDFACKNEGYSCTDSSTLLNAKYGEIVCGTDLKEYICGAQADWVGTGKTCDCNVKCTKDNVGVSCKDKYKCTVAKFGTSSYDCLGFEGAGCLTNNYCATGYSCQESTKTCKKDGVVTDLNADNCVNGDDLSLVIPSVDLDCGTSCASNDECAVGYNCNNKKCMSTKSVDVTKDLNKDNCVNGDDLSLVIPSVDLDCGTSCDTNDDCAVGYNCKNKKCMK